MKLTLRLLLPLGLLAASSHAATFTAVSSGSWSTPATWSVVGADADGIPDQGDDVTISGFSVSLTAINNTCHSFTINGGSTLVTNNQALGIYGNLTKNGGTITGSSSWSFYGNPATITGIFINSGNWYFTTGSNTTIAATTIIQKNNNLNLFSSSVVTNLGSVRLTTGSLSFGSAATWTNAANSYLQVSASMNNVGIFNCTASPNTVVYAGTSSTAIRRTTYHHLTVQNTGATVPTWVGGALTVNGNLTLISTTLNCANQDMTVGGNWTNTANTNCQNMGTVTFNGAGTQTITRTATERFNNLTHSGAGTLQLATGILVTGAFLQSSGTFDVSASNFSVQVNANFTLNGGTFNQRQGTVTMGGAAPQVIGGTVGVTFYNLTQTNATSVTVNIPVAMQNILSVNAGLFTVGTGSMTLIASGATTNAKIGPLGAGASLGGTNWVDQAYIDGPATAYWQFLGSSVNGTTLADWDNDPRFYMSGVGGNDGNACCPVFRSVRTYNTATGAYTNVTSTGTVLTRGKGYMVWMSDNMSSLTMPLVYDERSHTPNFGNVNIMMTAGGNGQGNNLVSNPYACPITYASVVAASPAASLGGSFSILQENGNYVTNPNGGTIAAHQGFFCVAGLSGNMTFTEACKTTAANPNIIRMADPANYLRIDVSNDVNGLGGETAVVLDPNAHNGYDVAYDMPFLPSPYETASNIWTTDADQKDNMLNCLDASADVVEIPLTIQANAAGTQLVSFRGLSNFSAYTCIWLEDPTNGTKVNLLNQDNYSFYAENGEKRTLTLHFDRTGACSPQQTVTESLDAQTQVYVSNDQISAHFYFNEVTAVRIDIIDAEGREIAAPQDFNVSNESVALPTPDAHGIYFVRIFQGDRAVTKKIYY